MITLKTVLDTLNNYFVDNRIIKSIKDDAIITAGKVEIADINETFPPNVYFIIEGSVFNNEVYQVTTSGTNFINADNIVAETTKEVTVKACLIPKAVLDFATEYATKPIPMYKSEKIGNYSYSTDKEGVEGFIINSLKAYYNGVVI